MVSVAFVVLVWFFGTIYFFSQSEILGVLLFFLPFVFAIAVGLRALYEYIYEVRTGKKSPRLRAIAAEKERLEAVAELRRKELRGLVAGHRQALRAKYLQLVKKDAYGNQLFEKWFAERDYFIEAVIIQQLGQNPAGMKMEELRALVDSSAIEFAYEKQDVSPDKIERMSPLEFEVHCASVLRSLGWDVQLTKGSGDQGVDVIADKDGMRLALQCKKYASPVGNAAVQEISAGMKFVLATHGAVVSNAEYTGAAKELAQANGISLLHYSELDGIGVDLRRA